MPERQRAKVDSHVRRCGRCRRQLCLMESDVAHFLELATPAPELLGVDEGLGNLLAKVRERLAQPRKTWDANIKAGVVANMELLFGSRVREAMGNSPTQPDGAGLLSSVEPLFTAFLGRRTAEQVVNRILAGAGEAHGAAMTSGS